MLDTFRISPKGPLASRPMRLLKPVRTVANHRAAAVMRGYWGARDRRPALGPLARRALVVLRGEVQVHGTIGSRMLRRLDTRGREIFVEIHTDSSATVLRGLKAARDDHDAYQPLLVCPVVLSLSSAAVEVAHRKIIAKMNRPGRHVRVALPTIETYSAAMRSALGAVDAEGGDDRSRAFLDIVFAEAEAWLDHAERLPALVQPGHDEDQPLEARATATQAAELGIAPGDPVAIPLFLPFLTLRRDRLAGMKSTIRDIAHWALLRRPDLQRVDIDIRAGRPRQTAPVPPAIVSASVVRDGVRDENATRALTRVVRTLLAEDCGGLPLAAIQGQETGAGNRDVLQDLRLVFTSRMADEDSSAHARLACLARYAAFDPALEEIA